MKQKIFFWDRGSQKIEEEKVYGSLFLEFLYGNQLFFRLMAELVRPFFSKIPFMSKLYGQVQKASISKKKIRPFIEKFSIDTEEFQDGVEAFQCFNDFFIRRLKKEKRPIDPDPKVLVMPADARYLLCENLSEQTHFFVKGQKFQLSQLVQDELLEKKYQGGSLVLARLCPTDYHRFHFPCAGFACEAKPHKGWLYSVNPIALRKRLKILWQNKKEITLFQTKHFGDMLLIEVGATFVGSIHQSYSFNSFVNKGDEKGYFEFGGSSLIMLFEKGKVRFEQDLVDYSRKSIEVRALLGQKLGVAL